MGSIFIFEAIVDTVFKGTSRVIGAAVIGAGVAVIFSETTGAIGVVFIIVVEATIRSCLIKGWLPLWARIFFLVRLHQAPIECGKVSLERVPHASVGSYSTYNRAHIY